MTTALHHASLLSQHACAAAAALDQGDATTGYAHLLAAEHALRDAKREIQFARPESALNGVQLFTDRAQQARIESARQPTTGGRIPTTPPTVHAHVATFDQVESPVGRPLAGAPAPRRAPGRYTLVDGRLLALSGTLTSPGRRSA